MRNDRSHELTSKECMKLLAKRHLGRVAVADEGGPAVYPVNYAVEQDAVLLHTDELPRLGGGGPITLQVDDLDESRPAGWSVTVRGEAREVEPGELDAVKRLAPRRRMTTDPGRYVRLRQASISGRRIDDAADDVPSNWLG